MRKMVLVVLIAFGSIALTGQPADCVLCGGWSCLKSSACSSGCVCVGEFGKLGVCVEAR